MAVFPAKRCQSNYVKLMTIVLSKEVLYATRTLRKSPVFTLTAVVTIARGIGAIRTLLQASASLQAWPAILYS